MPDGLLDFLKQFRCRDPDRLLHFALQLSAAIAMFLTTAMPRKKPFRLYVSRFDGHVIAVTSEPPFSL